MNHKNIITNQGKAALTAAVATGQKITLTHLSIGDGGGSTPSVSPSRTRLIGERAKIPLNQTRRHPTRSNWIEAEAIIGSSTGGYTVREVGLWADNLLIAYGSFPETYKPTANDGSAREMRIKMIIAIENAEVVQVSLDNSLIYATQSWVNDGYVAKSDIINSLSSTDQSRPLSAAQGKNLADAITTLDSTKASTSTAILAGQGLMGGGQLNSSRMISLGTPSKITATSNNAVTANSHSHEIDKASTTTQGIVMLSNKTDGTDSTKAATEYALGELRKAVDSISLDWVNIQNKPALADASHSHPWSQITGVPTASATVYGITRLNNDHTSTSGYEAATPFAVRQVHNKVIALEAGKLGKSETAASATKLATARTLAMTGDGTWQVEFDGSRSLSAELVLSPSGVTAGTYNAVVVDNKGRVTRGLTQTHGLITATSSTGTSNQSTHNANTYLNIVASGAGSASAVGSSTQITGTNGITVSSDTQGRLSITRDSNSPTATKLATARTISLTGAVTGNVSFDGSRSVQLPTTLNLGSNISILTGTVNHGGTIPLPEGYSEQQCRWLVSVAQDNPNGIPWDINENNQRLHYRYRCEAPTRQVIAQVYHGDQYGGGWRDSVANFIIIGVR